VGPATRVISEPDFVGQNGYRIARRTNPAVITSAWRDARGRQGFGDYLLSVEAAV